MSPPKYDRYPTSGNPKETNIILNGLESGNAKLCSSPSPFVAKVETFLRMNELDYSVEMVAPNDKKKCPRHKVPTIQHGQQLVCDSHFIVVYLENTFKDRLKVTYPNDESQRAKAQAAKMVAENFITFVPAFCNVYFDKSFKIFKGAPGFKGMPGFLKAIVFRKLRREMQHAIHLMGLRHNPEDLYLLLDESLQSLSGLLGTNDYYGGSSPCRDDASVYPILDMLAHSGVVPVADTLLAKYPNLTQYMQRMRQAYYPDSNPSKFLEKTK